MPSSIITFEEDFANVETSVLVTTGIYDLYVDKYEVRHGGKGDYVNITARIEDGEFKDQPVFLILSQSKAAQWKFKQFLLALGAKNPKGKKIDLNALLKKKFGGEIVHEEYDPGDGTGKRTVNRIANFFAAGTRKPEGGSIPVEAKEEKEEEGEVVF